MNTLKIEQELAQKYRYKPLDPELSAKYRDFFRANIPDWLKIDGADEPLYTSNGTMICESYERIVVGDYGAFVEFSCAKDYFNIQRGQEYRLSERYKNVKYIWLTIDDGSCVKIYHQRRGVLYADYMPCKFYVSVHEVFNEVD